MGVRMSIVLITFGAMLSVAVDLRAQGDALDTVGALTIVVGFIGLLMSALFFSANAPFGSQNLRYVREEAQ